jgi:hypothetical protein
LIDKSAEGINVVIFSSADKSAAKRPIKIENTTGVQNLIL